MMWLRLQDELEVVDHLHRPRIQGAGPRCACDHGYVSAFAARAQRGAVAGDATSNHHDPAQGLTIRLVSATSRFSCWTRSSTVGNAMSGWRYRTNRNSSRG